ncbi:translation initiation factor eIF 4e-like domain-containing protein [Cantharellus anzutake]|uniref:translation initiation factor eIF 4e-like domain-containing protein n=1 Tax=Cantharellus anzutake TaxID=1750568 RepID=UPI001903B226|nr:translation initiation factor eIF 4e-like domain-containing protein [Cantharellus anzutake]KAF8328196.1 translation initiation factor eIF 4e-like domain-containing protein [Cantharellus anzutake]
MAGSTLPESAQNSAQQALNAAIADSSLPPKPAGSEADFGLNEDEQILELQSSAPGIDSDRSVFDDPHTFTVKHPLYSSWTLWYDSPHIKTTGAPSTPSSSVPHTPSTTASNWMDVIKKVVTFDSVEEFWGLHNAVVPPSGLPQKANYYLFKDGIIPAWEDSANKNGGKWSVQFPRQKIANSIDQMWLYTMLAAIGETFDPALSEAAMGAQSDTAPPRSIVTGVICSARPNFYRLAIWTRLASPEVPLQLSSAEEAAIANGALHPSEAGPALQQRIAHLGLTFKTSILGFQKEEKLGGGLASELEFQSHKDSERKTKGTKKWVI